jgi:hypothetical protein
MPCVLAVAVILSFGAAGAVQQRSTAATDPTTAGIDYYGLECAPHDQQARRTNEPGGTQANYNGRTAD